MKFLSNKKVIDASQVFDSRFIETKALFLYLFNILPSVNYVYSIDGEKAFTSFCVEYASEIKQVYKYRWFKQEKKKFEFDKTVVVLRNNCLIEFSANYFELLHNGQQQRFTDHLVTFITG